MSFEDRRLAPYAMRSAKSRGRVHEENEHSFRLPFQRDRDRIIHSTAFRRLEYKTQVFVNHEGDYYRTRLTHTMEAAQITRTIARALRLNEDLAEAVVLAHDLGHTPFGHAGERVLNELMADYGGFEHNSQSLRIVDHLEERYPTFRGLNLCWEVREGIVKHSPPYDKPLAVDFQTGKSPCLEAQVVDYADEIAYNCHDIDDGLKSGLIGPDQLQQVSLWREALGTARDAFPAATGRVLRYEALRRVINLLVTDLIGTIETRIEAQPVRTLADIRALGRPLVGFSDGVEMQRFELKTFLMDNLYRHYRVVRMTRKAQDVMRALFGAYMDEPNQLPAHIVRHHRDEGEPLPRVIADYVAGMTDRFAIEEYRKLFDPLERV